MTEVLIHRHPRPSWAQIGETARAIRADRTPEEIARSAELGVEAVEALEAGNGRSLAAYDVSRIARALQVSIGELVSGDLREPVFRGNAPQEDQDEAVRLVRQLMDKYMTKVLLQPPTAS